jgi:hypothetical protein
MLLVTAVPASSGFTMESSSLGSGAIRVAFTSAPGTAAGPDSGVVCTVAFSPALNPTHNATLDFSETLARGPRDEVVAVTATGADVVPVKLLDLAVDDEPTGARVHWQVADASIAAGYRVLRAGAGEAEPVHEGLLPATTTEFVDDTAVPGERYRYWIEALGRDGSLERFGPVEITLTPRGLWAGLPYPNPARSGASLDLRAFAPDEVRACITDVTGRVVRELAGSTGASILHWDGRSSAAMSPGGNLLSWSRQVNGSCGIVSSEKLAGAALAVSPAHSRRASRGAPAGAFIARLRRGEPARGALHQGKRRIFTHRYRADRSQHNGAASRPPRLRGPSSLAGRSGCAAPARHEHFKPRFMRVDHPGDHPVQPAGFPTARHAGQRTQDYGLAPRTSGIISSNRRRRYRAAVMNAAWLG